MTRQQKDKFMFDINMANSPRRSHLRKMKKTNPQRYKYLISKLGIKR